MIHRLWTIVAFTVRSFIQYSDIEQFAYKIILNSLFETDSESLELKCSKISLTLLFCLMTSKYSILNNPKTKTITPITLIKTVRGIASRNKLIFFSKFLNADQISDTYKLYDTVLWRYFVSDRQPRSKFPSLKNDNSEIFVCSSLC